MRLEHRDHPALVTEACGGESGRNLGWMVGVIVDDRDSTDAAPHLEAPPHPGIAAQTLCRRGHVETQLADQRQHPGGVASDVPSRLGDAHHNRSPRPDQSEAHRGRKMLQVGDLPPGIGWLTVSDHAAHRGGEATPPGIVETGHHRSGDFPGDFGKRRFESLQGPVVIEMVRLDVGDHGTAHP